RLRWADDVNFEAGSVRAHATKSGEDYHVPMNDELRAFLRALPSRLRSAWVFPSETGDRKSTRLNSSHVSISYAVFCLKKKTKTTRQPPNRSRYHNCLYESS